MTGLWYEYVWTPGYGDDYNYDCATWTVLSDTEDKFVVYNHMKWQAEKEEDEKSDFLRFDFDFENADENGVRNARGVYGRDPSDSGKTDKQFTIVSSNYYSYLVGVSCREVGEGEEVQHEEDWFAWSREKSPSLFFRKKMRQVFSENNVEIDSLVKSPVKTCFGEDVFF